MIVSIDPGLKGAIAVLTNDGQIVAVRDMPLDKNRKFSAINTWQLLRSINDWSNELIHCAIEGLLSLPTDTNKVKLALAEYVKDHSEENLKAVNAELSKTDGRCGTKTMGVNYGILLGQIAALGWPCVIYSPRTWQSEQFRSATGKLTTKQKSYEVCCQLWPDKKELWEKSRGFYDGRCDALNIGEYLRRKLK